METSRWVGPGGFLLGIGKPPEGEGRPRAPINPLSLSRKRQVGIGISGPKKGKDQQTRRSVGLSLIVTYPAALTAKQKWRSVVNDFPLGYPGRRCLLPFRHRLKLGEDFGAERPRAARFDKYTFLGDREHRTLGS